MQLGGNLLDFLVLAILKNEDAYGYVLTQRAKELMDISDSTLYPVLRRLQKDGALQTYDQPYQGRNRRYYSITEKGRQCLEQLDMAWTELISQIRTIREGAPRPDASQEASAE